MKHSKLPWKLVLGDEIRASEDEHTNGRQYNSRISSRSYSDLVCTLHGDMKLPAPKANAAFILEACNAYYDNKRKAEAYEGLVDALKLTEYIQHYDDDCIPRATETAFKRAGALLRELGEL